MCFAPSKNTSTNGSVLHLNKSFLFFFLFFLRETQYFPFTSCWTSELNKQKYAVDSYIELNLFACKSIKGNLDTLTHHSLSLFFPEALLPLAGELSLPVFKLHDG